MYDRRLVWTGAPFTGNPERFHNLGRGKGVWVPGGSGMSSESRPREKGESDGGEEEGLPAL
jgi:hypothetical protein